MKLFTVTDRKQMSTFFHDILMEYTDECNKQPRSFWIK
jgi:hypothetical protein